MKHAYNLFNPLDYLRLIYLVFFRMDDFPEPLDQCEQRNLIIQGLIIIVGTNVIIGLLSNWRESLQQIIFFVAFGLGVGVGIGLTVNAFDAWRRFGLFVGFAMWRSGRNISVGVGAAVGVTVSLALLILVGMPGSAIFRIAVLTFGMAFGMTITAGFGVSVGVKESVAFVLVIVMVFFTIGTVAFGIALHMLSEWGYDGFKGLIIGSLLVGICGLITSLSSVIVAGTAMRFITNVVKTDSAQLNWGFGMGLLGLFSVGFGYLFSFIEYPFINLEYMILWGARLLGVSVLFFLFISRLVLWPFEALICIIGYTLGMKSKDPETLFQAIQNWYFDHHTFFPLPFEARALQKLGNLNRDKGIEAAIMMARNSCHILESVHALKYFALQSPYDVQAYITRILNWDDRDRLSRFTFHKQPEAISRVRTAYQILIQLADELAAERSKRTQDKLLLNVMRDILEKSEKSDDPTFNQIQNNLRQSLEQMRLANRLAGDSKILHSNEMVALYTCILNALTSPDISQISEFKTPSLPVEYAPALFPQQLANLLSAMNDIAQTIKGFNHATSKVTRHNALLKANEQLLYLVYQAEIAPPPAGPLLVMVIAHWERLIAAAFGELSRAQTHGPIANPFVIANPVRGDQFVGREDIMTRLEELWSGKGQKPSVVLYGHRRMGKSSILHNLGARFGTQTQIVDFSIQRQNNIESASELLYNLALSIYDDLPDAMKEQLEGGEPSEETFTQHNPQTGFYRFLKRLDRVRGETRFIITVDEFEYLEDLIESRKLDPSLIDFWRYLIQNFSCFIMAFAGLHTLREMTEDYWHPLYAGVPAIPVSFLSPKSAYRLITQPTPGFSLDYDQGAVDQIIDLANGQPYLTQLICHGLVTRFNRQTFEEGKERERRFRLDDVEAVINAPEFFRDGNAYFTGVWAQAEKSQPPEQTAVLKALSISDHGMIIEGISKHTTCNPETIQQALAALTAHDVVRKTEDRWHISVELMRRWVNQKENET